jgi:hypothetical protein
MTNDEEADREFMAQLVLRERQRLTSALTAHRAETESEQGISGPALDQLADLAARVRVIECAAELGILAADASGRVPQPLFGKGHVPVSQMEAATDFTETLESGPGGQFRWTQSPRLELDLPIQRLRPRYIRIRFVSIIKTEYARSALLKIDDVPVRYWLGRSKTDHFFECAIPVSEDLVSTRVRLEIDSVHSPKELGLSNDERPLGIALIAVEFSSQPQAGLVTRIRSRLPRSVAPNSSDQ